MKKILTALLLSLVSCQGCADKTVPVPVTPAPVVAVDPVDQQVTVEKMTVTLPLSWVKLNEDSDSLSYVNKTKKNLVLLAKEECKMTYTQCMVSSLKGMMLAGVEILSAEDTELNGNKFALILSKKDDVKIWTWLTHRNDTLYMLSCGGLEEDLSNQEICTKISSTLKLQ